MSIGSLFSGIGGLELGLESCGLGPVLWQCDSDPCARAVLAEHWPGVKRFDDVREVDGTATRVDVVCGGFPCQDVSVAGEQRGLTADRSGLWWEFRRVVRQQRPSAVFIENVYRGWRRWLPVVRRSLWRVGYASLPIRVRAADVGAPHERARVFVLAYADRERLRQLAERLPGGRAGGVRGQAVAGNDGAPLADAHGAGLEVRVLLERQEQPPALGGGAFPPGPDGLDGWDGPQPAIRRGDDGVPGRTHRLRLLGNSVVPQAAALAWRTLIARVA